MKTVNRILALLLFPLFAVAQPAFNWALTSDYTTDLDNAYSVAADTKGNAWVAGYFKDTLTVGSTVMTAAPNDGTDDYECFLLKYDSTGTALWAKSFGGGKSQRITDVAVDNAGNAYVVGFYDDTLSIGSTLFLETQSDGGFLAKFDKNGVFKWAVNIHGYGDQDINSVDVLANGSAIHIGWKAFDDLYIEGTDGTSTYADLGLGRACFAKFNKNGVLQWLNTDAACLLQYFSVNSLGVDKSGNTVAVGNFRYASFTAASIGTTLTESGALGDCWVMKIGKYGVTQWLKGIHGTGIDNLFGIDFGLSNHILLGGTFTSSITIGSTTYTAQDATGDLFVAKMRTSNGSILWSKDVNVDDGVNMESSPYDREGAFCTDVDGNAYVAGGYDGNLIFAGDTVTSGASASFEGFILKFDTNGNEIWMADYEGNSSDLVAGLAVGINDDKLYAVGRFWNEVTFGGTTLDENNEYDIDFYLTQLTLSESERPAIAARAAAAPALPIALWPNPATELVSIGWEIPGAVQSAEIRLVNALGQTVLAQPIESRGEGRETLRISHLPSGIYQIHLLLDGHLAAHNSLIVSKK